MMFLSVVMLSCANRSSDAPPCAHWAEPTAFPVGQWPQRAATGDIDGNGTLDVVITAAGENKLVTYSGDGRGGFKNPLEYQVDALEYIAGLAIGRFDADENLDVIVGDTSGIPALHVFGNNGGRLLQESDATMYTGEWDPDLYGSPDEYPMFWDVDGDGSTELFTSGRTTKLIGTWTRGTDGLERRAPQYVPFFTVGSADFTIAHLDGDESPDMVGLDKPSGVVYSLGAGSGVFAEPAHAEIGLYGRGLTVGDFDGDGISDVIIVGPPIEAGDQSDQTAMEILVGNGSGFESAKRVDGRGYVVASADLDGDGVDDVVASDHFTLSVMLSDSSTRIELEAGPASVDLLLVDLNGDGGRDFILLDNIDGMMRIAMTSCL